jgi:hypothetical protein
MPGLKGTRAFHPINEILNQGIIKTIPMMPTQKPSWIYTDNETAELKSHPMGPDWIDYTKQQIRMRQEIGKRMCRYFNEIEMSIELKSIHEGHPMWKFYIDKNGIPKRIYGMHNDNGNWKAYTASADFLSTSKSEGEIPLSDLTSVDEWSEAHLNMIRMTAAPGVFLDPLGFLLLIRAHHHV